MPPPNDLAADAETLSLPTDSAAGTTIGSVTGGPWDNSYANVWYRFAPTVNVVVKLTLTKTAGDPAGFPFADVYKATADPPTSWSDLPIWLGGVGDGASTSVEMNFALTGGQVYYVDVYASTGAPLYETPGMDFNISVAPADNPPNDFIVDAVVVSTTPTAPIQGTIVGATAEAEESDAWDEDPSVWYRLENGGPGACSVEIKSTTPGWNPMVEAFYVVNDPPQTFDDLEQNDINALYVGDGTERPPRKTLELTAQTADVIYLRVSKYDFNPPVAEGAFSLTVGVTPPQVCLNAADYLGSSPTASIVGGAVREGQSIDYSWGSSPVRPWEGWMGDQRDTLSIPGDDIASSPGFYAVTIKTKNAMASFVVGLIRNGQPLWPGAEIDSSFTSTPYEDYVTMPAGSLHPNTLDMVRYLPVKPGDTIEVVVARAGGSGTIDIDQICFQRALNAVEAPAYAILDIPDYPLGTSAGDMATNAQQGDLIVGKDTVPTFTQHATTGFDMCVTDDGRVWVAHMQRNGMTGAGVTGPVLHYWNGASWVLVSDDVEGLGVKRAAPSSSLGGPQTISMDTDGTDIWLVYHVDDGPNTYGGGRRYGLRVKKYDVSAGTFSNVGGKFHGTNSDVGGSAAAPWEYTRAEVGSFGDTPTIRVSPNGVPWVGFVDYEAAAGYENYFPYFGLFPYVARWTGSSWDIHRLPLRSEFTQPTAAVFQAKDHRVASGTTSEETYLGEVCVKETQTAYNNDTCSFVPPAGRWMFQPRLAKNYVSGAVCGLEFKWYKNGSPLTPFTADGDSGDSATDFAWTRWGQGQLPEVWTECDGVTDTISVRLKKTGAGVEDIYIDELICWPAEVFVQQDGFGMNCAFVDDGQPHVGLFMHRVGETGLGENPGALYQTTFTVPRLDDPDAPDYWAPDTAGDQCWNWQTWVYCEWDGSQWVRKWQRLVEEDAPYHVYLRTYADQVASTPPVGHFQQGFGFATDGEDNYMTANLGGGQAFGFFPDQIVALKIGQNGFVPFTDGPPGGLTSFGYPLWDDGDGGYGQYSWGWDTTGRSICVDPDGNVWVGFSSIGGAPGEYTDVLVHAALNGIGDWFVAALNNEEFGYDNTYASTPSICASPDGTKIYILWDTFIYDNGVTPNEPYTFGVWECDVIPAAKIPLVPAPAGVHMDHTFYAEGSTAG